MDKVNKIIKILVLSDLFLFAGWGLISPIFSVFIVEEIIGATVVTVGVATSIYWVARSSVYIPLARFLDKRKGEKDDVYALIFSLTMVGFAAFMMVFAKTPLQLYLAHGFHGLVFGIYQIAWPSIFSRHLDQGKVSLDWSLDKVLVGAAVATTSLLGAHAANLWGFRTVFIITAILSWVSVLILMTMPKLLFPNKVSQRIEDDTQAHRKHKQTSTPGL